MSQQSLSGLISSGKLGIELEEPSISAWLKQESETFVKVMRVPASSKERASYRASCQVEPAESKASPFCRLEALLSGSGDRPAAARKSKGVHWSAKQIKAKLLQGNLAELDQVSEGSIRDALARFPEFSPLGQASSRYLDAPKCVSSRVGQLLAAKAEEFLPNPEFRKIAIQLYEKAGTCTDDVYTARAHYRAGLLHLWEENCSGALPHFQALIQTSEGADYRSRALYWLQSCAKQVGQEEVAKKAREDLIARHPFSLHTLLLHRQPAELVRQYALDRKDSSVNFRTWKKPEVNGMVRAIEALLSAQEVGLARQALDEVSKNSEAFDELEPEFQLYVAYLYNRVNNYVGKFKVLSPLFRDHPEMVSKIALELYYPQKELNLSQTPSHPVNPFVVLSLIRQESAFNERARSPAGAMGLMQILPKTARTIERVKPRELYDPKSNVRIGSKYFYELQRRFDGDVELALAAYNAGPKKVDEWKRRYPVSNRLLFVDLIPYKETREYVASIARNYFWYSSLYDKETKEDRSWRDMGSVFKLFASNNT